MRTRHSLVVAASAACLVAAATHVAPAAAAPDPLGRTPVAKPSKTSVELKLLGTNETGVFDASAAEITAHDPSTQRLFVVNAASGTVDVLDVSDPTSPTKVCALQTAGLRATDGSTIGAGAVVNSVDVSDGVLAVAVEADDKTDRGWVAFFATDDEAPFLSAVRAGSLPDMVTFTPDGRSVLVANEGEPADDFSTDPEGSASLVDVAGGFSALGQGDVRTATFRAYDEGRALADGVRVFGPDAPVPAGQEPAGRIARNLEPEYLTVAKDSRTAWVTLQEANAVGVVDLASGEITDVWPIPLKDWTAPGNVLDASKRDDAINRQNWPVRGLAMPDAISSYALRGQTLLVTANEGDAREWGDYEEPVRIGDDDYELCEDVFHNAEELKQDENLGRLNATTASGLRADDSCYEEIHVFGGRSFSVFTTDGQLVFDSGAQIGAQDRRTDRGR